MKDEETVEATAEATRPMVIASLHHRTLDHLVHREQGLLHLPRLPATGAVDGMTEARTETVTAEEPPNGGAQAADPTPQRAVTVMASPETDRQAARVLEETRETIGSARRSGS